MPDPTLIGKPGPSARDPLPMPLLRTTVGDVLRRLRLEQGRTLADVARAANVSMPYLSELERGRKEASSEVLAALCAALGIGLSDLIERVGRDLAEEQARRAPVIRLDHALLSRPAARQAPGRPAGPVGSGSASAVCLLAA